MDKKYCVYIHKFPNGKVYIGVTCKKVEYRWNNGNGYGKNQRKMYNAIKKYGWENIKHEILYEKLTKEEAECKEKELIELYKSTNDKYGYNIEKGGNLNKEINNETRELLKLHHKGMTGKKRSKEECIRIGNASKQRWASMSEEQRYKEKMRLKKICTGRKTWNKGVKNCFNEDTIQKMSMAKKGKPSSLKGRKISFEQKQKIAFSHIGKTASEEAKEKMKKHNANSKKIIILENGTIFNSGKECSEALGCHRSNPNLVCNGKRKSCKGYHLMWLEDYLKQRESKFANILADNLF